MTDRYQIIKLISKDPAGGMYLAEDTTLERKVVFRHIDSDGMEDRPETWAQDFASFSGKLCALQHPNLLTIYDVAVDDNGVSMVTQYVQGESLAERLEKGPLRQMGVYRMASDLLEALHAAHSNGIYHGALHTGSVKRLPRATGGHRYLIVDLGLNTLATMVKGKDVHIADPVLLAPELHDGKNKPDESADLFMLGQLCYTALAGGHPFAEESADECARAHQAGELPPLVEFAPGIQPDFSAWVMHLSAGEKSQRPASIKEAMESLQQITLNEPAPNIAGKTQAIVTASPDSTVPTSAQVAVAQEAVPIIDSDSSDKTSNKKTIIIIASLCLLIGLVFLLGLTRSKQAGETESDAALAAVPEGVKIYLHDVKLVNTMANRAKPVLVDLETDKTLDWLVATGAPASSKRTEREKGSYIQSLFAKGSFKEFAMKNVPVKFQSGDDELIPKAATDSKKNHKAKPGDGWDMILRVPPKHQGALLVSLYMLQSHCDFVVAVTLPDGKEVITLNIPKQEPGTIKIPMEIPKPKPGGFYSIRITATSPEPKKGFTMGINAIHIERR